METLGWLAFIALAWVGGMFINVSRRVTALEKRVYRLERGIADLVDF